MNRRIVLASIAIVALAVVSCRSADKVSGPGTNARVEVSSDPAGASIILDSENTGKITPDLLRDVAVGKTHEIIVKLVKDNVTYGYRVSGLQVYPDSLIKISAPLTMRCTSGDTNCVPFSKRHTVGNTLGVSTIANGQMFTYNPNSQTGGSGLFYPAGTSNGYIAGGLPLIAYINGTATRDTLSIGIYDTNYLAGRPAPSVTQTSERYSAKQSFWIVPPSTIINTPQPTVRGIEVSEELIGVSSQSDVAFVKLTYTNITNSASYRTIDPLLPTAGITYNWVYLGFALDPDIGASEDDMITYDPSLNMVYAYDMDFAEPVFSTAWVDKPALVGLRLMEAPADATVKVLNAWPRGNDFGGGDLTERVGWGIMSGTRSVPPDFAGQQIGYTPSAPGDYRMMVSAGPITLAPGASASITVAIILAAPVPGTYTPGTAVDPGNPTVADRTIAKIAGALIEKAKALTLP